MNYVISKPPRKRPKTNVKKPKGPGSYILPAIIESPKAILFSVIKPVVLSVGVNSI